MQKLTLEDDNIKMEPEFSHLPDSDTYIKKLESRLAKVKGSEKELTSKDMISVLQNARDDYMCHLISGSVNRLDVLSDIDPDKEVQLSYFEKKLFPEKNGATNEELQHLLESDLLAKISESNVKVPSDTQVDR
ncbi:uncharacterized protein LOC118190538 [Stegodyphus dumicola]|uniref:uncharacterized protein LOC118190538 n=1 Tax=Stegodyphus dumicola TaxID=202533 RepID=UPI0015AA78BB|nr:uncharacterized protein LOC118190538 [Stegodyphus dumicola]